jgi:hypothetical protein
MAPLKSALQPKLSAPIDAHSAPSAGTSKVGIGMEQRLLVGRRTPKPCLRRRDGAGEIGEQGHALGFVPTPIVETRIERDGGYHESQ